MFRKSKIDRVFELQREKREAQEAEKAASENGLSADTAEEYSIEEEDSHPIVAEDSPEARERWKKQKKEERTENVKNFFSMLIAAVLVFLPALLVLVAAFLLFIWLFFKAF
ncbi:MAG: hypothetical protein PHR78_04260 [Eubacteriales bacterium]|nr:hypothetical protein [Eubacteriales bacterium]MDD4324732.1 hypothetical protein [Eubacteriales bacterium]MDD4541362.1 hypothetical protein [Eubacteriales bacterium]